MLHNCLFLGLNRKIHKDKVNLEQPIITRVEVKKNLLRNVGNAKQCKLCDKIFSTEKSAVAHVFDFHQDLLQPGKEKGKINKQQCKKIIEMTNIEQMKAESKKLDTGISQDKWKCKYCSTIFLCLEDTIPHMKQMHGIIRPDAREKSLKKIV